MVDKEKDGVPQTEKLDAKTDYEWRQLASQVIKSRTGEYSSRTNVSLLAAAEREPQAPSAPAFRLWMADNLAIDGDYSEAITAYDDCVRACDSARPLSAHQDLVAGALMHKAQALTLSGDLTGAMAAYNELFSQRPAQPVAAFEAGMMAERLNDHSTAVAYYKRIASPDLSARTDDPAQLARRAIERLNSKDAYYSQNVTTLADQLTVALERQDTCSLSRIASSTHFAVGPVGGHTGFESLELLDEFLNELAQGNVKVKRQLLGSGGKRYLPSTGWKGKWFHGAVSLIITEAPAGWQWTGIALHNANDHWVERWKPSVIQTNQPLPFEILAPWPRGLCFTAGGIREWVAQVAFVASAWPFGALVALGLASRNCCGWGPRGFYYNALVSHDGASAFAIDFTRYRRFFPNVPKNAGTPVLAVREGIVSSVYSGTRTGDPGLNNHVHIEHADPDNATDKSRFTSRYLHLEGPFKILQSQGMPVRLGSRLGFMDNTGTNSVFSHLHFSIHDRQLTYPDVPWGKSVRPSPMSGQTLSDSDSNKCIKSNNVDYTGENIVLQPSSFAGQNWLITPVALAVNETPPRSVAEQKWLLVLSGVANIDLKGNGPKWLRETFRIWPDLLAPMNHAINLHNIPTPPDGYNLKFQVEQWVPYSAPSSMYNKKHSVNSGFAVDVWRPHPFGSDTDVVTNTPFGNIFNGIQVDVAVSDIDAFFYRLSYHIVLLGKIRFGEPTIID